MLKTSDLHTDHLTESFLIINVLCWVQMNLNHVGGKGEYNYNNTCTIQIFSVWYSVKLHLSLKRVWL